MNGLRRAARAFGARAAFSSLALLSPGRLVSAAELPWGAPREHNYVDVGVAKLPDGAIELQGTFLWLAVTGKPAGEGFRFEGEAGDDVFEAAAAPAARGWRLEGPGVQASVAGGPGGFAVRGRAGQPFELEATARPDGGYDLLMRPEVQLRIVRSGERGWAIYGIIDKTRFDEKALALASACAALALPSGLVTNPRPGRTESPGSRRAAFPERDSKFDPSERAWGWSTARPRSPHRS